MDNVVAFWLSPLEDLISTHGSHTSTVLSNPETFGLSEEQALSLFVGGEENAVIEYLLDKGWIRVRYQFGFVLIFFG